MIAGTSNVLKPATTKAAVVPGLSCSSRCGWRSAWFSRSSLGAAGRRG